MSLKSKLFFHKLFNWEYWSTNVVYAPVLLLWAYHSLRNKSFYSFAYTNPGIKNGGMMNVNKMDIYRLLPKYTYPITVEIHQQSFEEVMELVNQQQISFPLIVKPCFGLRGISVQKLYNKAELKAYHNNRTYEYMVQALIPYENEIGVFYVRYPNQTKGEITGITGKEFLSVIGDGVSSLEELMLQDNRYAFQIERFKGKRDLNEVLPKGERVELEPIGNHNLGTTFLDYSDKITSELTAVFDEISHQIEGVFYGRYDVRFKDWESFYQGKHFEIIELNAALAEPTHMYDPKHSFWFGQKEIFRHHHKMYSIAGQNLKSGLAKRQSLWHFRQQMKIHRETIEGMRG